MEVGCSLKGGRYFQTLFCGGLWFTIRFFIRLSLYTRLIAFLIQYTGLEEFNISCTYSPPNYYQTPEHHKFVLEKYSNEYKLGQVSQGFTLKQVEEWVGHYRTAPLNIIECMPGKFHITVDHSHPQNNPLIQSVNLHIDTKRFQCDWGTFYSCWLQVADAPPGTEAAIFDVDSAFWNIPTLPSHQPFTALLINNLVVFDHRLNFGISPAPGIFGFVADAIVSIYKYVGIESIIKWVDNFVFF